jgi:hypothetical protein
MQKRFEHEPRGFCCHDGKVELNELNVPNELMRLTFVTILGFSMVISLSLLYIVTSIALLQAGRTVACTPFVQMARSITT